MSTTLPRKVLFVITKSNWGGAQAYVYTLATACQKQGIEAVVALGGTGAAGAAEGLLAQRLATSGIRTIFLHSFARDISLLRELHAFHELYRVIRKERPDVLHVNSSKAGGIGALAGRLLGVPSIVFTAHGWPHREVRNVGEHTFIWLASFLTVLLSGRVIVVSNRDFTETPGGTFRKNVLLIYNGIRADASLLSRQEAHRELVVHAPSLPKDTPYIVNIGELTPNKAHHVLLESLALQTSHYFCVICGDGELRETLEEQARALGIESNVAFLGFVPNAADLLPGADVFVLPSEKEGLPFVVLEAGRAGLPVIASDTGGIPEIISDKSLGVLVPPHDAPALAAALSDLLSHPEKRAPLGKTLQARVHDVFSEENMVTKTLAVY